MTDDPRIRDLLAHDVEEPVPPEHERLIRAALSAQLGTAGGIGDGGSGGGRGSSEASPSGERASIESTTNATGAGAGLATAGTAWKIVTVALVGLGAGATGFAIGRATAPSSREPLHGPSVAGPGTDSSSAAQGSRVVEAASVAAGKPPSIGSGAAPPSASAMAAMASPSSSAAARAAGALIPKTDSGEHGDSAGFDREQSLLERARSALLRHDTAAAEAALATLRKEFPRPKHGEEREYLEMLVLRERGDTAQARQRADAFLKKYPSSLLRGRVERIANEP